MQKNKKLNPTTIPAIWRRVFARPKYIPDCISILLLGPGVKAAITERIKKFHKDVMGDSITDSGKKSSPRRK